MLVTDPLDLLLGPDGDLVVERDLTWTRGLEAIAQAARIAVQMIRGEWFLDLDEGVPYFERDGIPAGAALLGSRFDESKARAMFRTALLTVPGVNTVRTLTAKLDAATRTLTVTWVLATVFGDTPADSLNLGVN